MRIKTVQPKSGAKIKNNPRGYSQKKLIHYFNHLPICLPAAAAGLAGTLAAALLFYNKAAGLLPGAFAGIYIARLVQKEMEQRRTRRRRDALKRLLISMETGLEAGYSLENAVFAAVEDLGRIYGRDTDIGGLLEDLRHQILLRKPVWQAFQQFGEKTGLEEAGELAQVLRVQQRAGGNLILTMRSTVEKLQAGMEVQQEIETAIAEKKLEQRIMTVMPAMIILYMRFTNGAYIAPLYTTAAGNVIMTVAMVLNIAGDALGNRLVGKDMTV